MKFLQANWPTPHELLVYGPPMLLWAFAALTIAGWLKRRHAFRTGYTRKVFHFAIFFTVAALQATVGPRAVCLFGAMTTVVIAYALVRGEGNSHYEAIAREKDAPCRTHYIIVPYLATLLGGLTTSTILSGTSLYGFLVTGIGDAIGEPVGTRFGKHPYRVPSMRGVTCTRTLEGSAAVFSVSTLAALAAALLLGGFSQPFMPLIGVAFLIGLASALCEAVSPHGWDNFTLQVVPAAIAYAYHAAVT
jgi:phytol kinase